MEDPPGYKPAFFLHPMSRWHLYGEFKNGVNTGGLIQLVKLFGIAGIFVLLLACINFMNLSTARSEKKSKGSRHTENTWFSKRATDKTVLHGITVSISYRLASKYTHCAAIIAFF